MRDRSDRLLRVALISASIPIPPTTNTAKSDPIKLDWLDESSITIANTTKRMPSIEPTIRSDLDLISVLDDFSFINFKSKYKVLVHFPYMSINGRKLCDVNQVASNTASSNETAYSSRVLPN